MIAINVGMIIILFFVSSWIIIHLGIKPERGGRPPSDNISIRIKRVVSGNLFHEKDKDRVVRDELYMNSIKVPRVIIMYTTRFRCIRVGL